MRVVLLLRPDMFNSLGLQNQNTKICDNSVFLDWRTEYKNHRTSDLFRVIDHLIACQQQGELNLGVAWDHYFPWDAPNVIDKYQTRTSFISFLRWPYYRPRDIVTMLMILKDMVRNIGSCADTFGLSDFANPDFRRVYSDYLLGEVKDQLTFYYSAQEYDLFLGFFSFLNGIDKFSHIVYLKTFDKFKNAIDFMGHEVPKFMTSPLAFLQFLYDLNIISYVERPVDDRPYVRWCFRERSYGNITPKVKEGVDYEVFYGLSKALNVGQAFR